VVTSPLAQQALLVKACGSVGIGRFFRQALDSAASSFQWWDTTPSHSRQSVRRVTNRIHILILTTITKLSWY